MGRVKKAQDTKNMMSLGHIAQKQISVPFFIADILHLFFYFFFPVFLILHVSVKLCKLPVKYAHFMAITSRVGTFKL